METKFNDVLDRFYRKAIINILCISILSFFILYSFEASTNPDTFYANEYLKWSSIALLFLEIAPNIIILYPICKYKKYYDLKTIVINHSTFTLATSCFVLHLIAPIACIYNYLKPEIMSVLVVCAILSVISGCIGLKNAK